MAECLVLTFFAVLVVVVFQQISTSLVEQGVASGGPYNDAASYPRFVALLIIALSLLRVLTLGFGREETASVAPAPGGYRRAALMIAIFALYLASLPYLGYTLASPLMLFVGMKLCWMRGLLRPAAISMVVVLVIGAIFTFGLRVVLPRPQLGLLPDWMF